MFSSILPDSCCYKYVGLSANKTKHIWQDRASKIVFIHSHLQDPFDKEISLFLSLEKGRSKIENENGIAKYPKRLVLKVSSPQLGLKKVKLTREVIKGQFIFCPSEEDLINIVGFSTNIKNHWLLYKLIAKAK
jgi:hypothetical protein